MTSRLKISPEAAELKARIYLSRFSNDEKKELLDLAMEHLKRRVDQHHYDGETNPYILLEDAVEAFAVLYMPQPVALENTHERVLAWVTALLKADTAVYDKTIHTALECLADDVRTTRTI